MNSVIAGPRRGAVVLVLALAAGLTLGARVGAAEEKPVVLELLVPADAVVELNGGPTRSTGEDRVFRSAPVPVGKRYTYTLKVTSQGKTVTQSVSVAAGEENRVDLRDQLKATAAPRTPEPKPTPKEAARPVAADEPKPAKPEPKPAAVEPKPEPKPEEKQAAKPEPKPAPTPEGKPEPKPAPKVEAKPAAKPDAAPETKLDPKPLLREDPKPAPQAAPPTDGPLVLGLPDGVELQPGEGKYVLVRITPRAPAALAAEPVLTFADLSAAGLTWEPYTLPEFKAGGDPYVVGYVVRAAAAAPLGETEVKLTAAAGRLQAAGAVKVKVQKPSDK